MVGTFGGEECIEKSLKPSVTINFHFFYYNEKYSQRLFELCRNR